jgi:2'-5' RNA ligase
MRLFIALDLDATIREKIARFLDGVRGFSPDARWVRPESLHVTLKFIGQMPDENLPQVISTLQQIKANAFEIHIAGYGFFPTHKAPRVFWIGIQAESQLPSLAATIDDQMAKLGVPREEHPFSPHLTLARRAGGSGAPRKEKNDRPNQSFARLQEKLTAMSALDFGAMTARKFFLYQSELSHTGSRYTKLFDFPLT